jgi:hypothetical protein
MSENCFCGVKRAEYTVKKKGPNSGKSFFTCKKRKCKYFEWKETRYDSSRFRRGSCYRCGRYNCDAEECEEEFDWFGNKIPEDWSDH